MEAAWLELPKRSGVETPNGINENGLIGRYQSSQLERGR